MMGSALILSSCGGGVDNSALDERLTASEDVEAAVASFSEGGATNGEEYFSGVLAEVVEVDVKFREVESLDEIDAAEEDITAVLDEAIEKIKSSRKSLDLYKNESWSKRQEMHDLTIEWFAVVEALINDYLYDLAEPMSRPDDTWTDEELLFYDDYATAYDEFLDVDGRWVDFQYVYAAANGFVISGTIDEDAMVEEEMADDVH